MGDDTKSETPTTALKKPQQKFVRGDELPIPRGFAKGVGNGSPLRPQTRYGMQLQRNTPAKKFAMKFMELIMKRRPVDRPDGLPGHMQFVQCVIKLFTMH